MTIRFRSRIATSAFVAIASVAAMGQMAFGQIVKAPPVPDGLQAPEGTVAFLEGHASGTQDYVCLPSATGFAWTFFGPQATLFTDFKVFQKDIRQQIITHFLSPNPDEKGLPRATWQSSIDTSAVWAKTTKASTDPNFVAAGAIPWLLLEVVGAQAGPAGGNILTPAVAVQRLNTRGGVAPPPDTCSKATDVGATALVPYTADYFFYRKVSSGY